MRTYLQMGEVGRLYWAKGAQRERVCVCERAYVGTWDDGNDRSDGG